MTASPLPNPVSPSGIAKSPSARPLKPPQACDACRVRKIKCVREKDYNDPGSSSGSGPLQKSCIPCAQAGFRCSVDYRPKKRGPPNRTIERMNAGQRKVTRIAVAVPAPAPTTDDVDLDSRRPRSPVITGERQANLAAEVAQAEVVWDRRGRRADRDAQPSVSIGRNPAAAESGHGLDTLFDQSYHPAEIHTQSHINFSSHLPSTNATSTTSTPNPFEAIMSRPFLLQCIDMFFKHLYCLTPCVHRPSLLADLDARREQRPGEEEWTSLVLMLSAAVLAQVPWAFAPMSKSEIRKLVEKCYKAAKNWALEDHKEATLTRCIVLYLGALVVQLLGQASTVRMLLGACWNLIFELNLHNETSYVGLDPVESELRRRMYWLAIGWDKASSAVRNTPSNICRDHCATTKLPAPLDDEYISREGYGIPPPGKTSLIAGFRYVSRLFGLLGEILDLRRNDHLRPPEGIALQMRLNDVDELFNQILSLMIGCPDELRLPSAAQDPVFDVLDWDAILADVQALVQDPTTQPAPNDSFLVQQANIYVTQQMARQVTLDYRAYLLSLQRCQQQNRLQVGGLSPDTHSATGNLGHHQTNLDEEKDRTADNLLHIISTIPRQALAVNGHAILSKVRFIAVTQLEALEALSGQTLDLMQQQRLATAQNYLGNFLQVLSDIDALTSIDEQVIL